MEAPYLSRLEERYRERGFQVIAVDVEDKETREALTAYARKGKLTHPILPGGSRAGDLYDVEKVLPTVFWIDHRGRVIRRQSGFRSETAREMERTVLDLLRERDADAKGGESTRGVHHGGGYRSSPKGEEGSDTEGLR